MSSPQKPHLLMMIDSLRCGGAEKQFIEIVNRINRDKFDISVCLTTDTGILLKYLNRKKLVHFISIRKKTPWDFFKILIQVRKILKKTKPDVVHCWLSYSNLLSQLASIKHHSYKMVAGIRCSPKFYKQQNLFTQVIKRFIFDWPNKKSDIILANSQNVLNELIKMGYPHDKSFFIPNGIDCRHISNAAAFTRFENLDAFMQDNITLVTAGRLEKQKGFKYLFSAIKSLVYLYPKLKLLVIGEGRLRENLENKIKGLNLENNIHLIGFREDIHCIMKAADIFVLPSIFEGMPNVVMEAMALGKPIVASSVDGTKELIKHKKTGWLVPPRDPNALAEAITILLKNPELKSKLANNAKREINNTYNIKKITAKYEALYEKLLHLNSR